MGSANAVVTNATVNTNLSVLYTTRGAKDGMTLAQGAVAGTSMLTMPFATLEETMRRPDDRYLLVANESDGAGWRRVNLAKYASGDLSLNMPAPFVATFSSVATPNWRPVYTFEDRPGTRSYELTLYFAPVRNQDHTFDTTIDPAWLTPGAQHTITFPDFSGCRASPAPGCPRTSRVLSASPTRRLALPPNKPALRAP